MRSQTLRILMLALFGLWFGAVLPGHERGAITMPGFGDRSAGGAGCELASSSCHRCPDSKAAAGDSDGDSKQSKRERAKHCAICFQMGMMDAPVAIHFAPPASELIGSLPLPAYRSIVGILSCDVIRTRGPPNSSAAV